MARHLRPAPGVMGSMAKLGRPVAIAVAAALLLGFAAAWTAAAGSTGRPSSTGSTATPAATPAATPRPDATPARDFVYTTGRVTIRLTEEGLAPRRVLAAVGHDLTVTLVNTTATRRCFSIDELAIDIEVAPGETETITLEGPALGTYRLRSETPDHEGEGWSGTLTIFI